MIQKLTIEIDVPEGYEATGEYRRPTRGEMFVTDSGIAVNRDCLRKQVIVRKKWAFPPWFREGWWLHKSDYNREWFVYEGPGEPSIFAPPLWAFHGETFTPPQCEKIQCVRT